jgi:hypothetical protein
VANLSTDLANTNSDLGNLTTTVTNQGNDIANLQGAVYSNANVATFLDNFGSNSIFTTGNISAGDVTLTNLYSPNFYGNAITYTNATGYVTSSNLFKYDPSTEVLTVGNVSTTGNITTGIITANILAGDGGNIANITGANVTGEVAVANTVSNPSQPNITALGTIVSLTANALTVNGTMTANGNAQFNADVYFAGNVTIPGNVTQISGNSGQFFGNAVTGFGALYAGLPAGYTLLNQEVMQYATSFDGYTQVSMQNINSGSQATGDFVITADNGNDTTNHIDMGMAGSGYNGLLANNSLGTSLYANDGYLYTRGNVNGGNLILGSNQANGVVRIIANGASNIADVVATFSNTGLSVASNVSANYFLGNGSQLTGLDSSPAIVSINNSIANTDGNVANLTTSLGNTNSNVANLTTSLGNTDANVANLVTITTNTNSNVANLTTSLGNTNSNVANLTTAVGNTDSNVANLVTITTSTNSNVSNVVSDLANTNSTVANLSTTVSSQGNAIANLEGLTYGNANVAGYLPTYTGNVTADNISATGNITGNYLLGNGSQLTNLPAPAVAQDITSVGAMSLMTYDGNLKYVSYATVEPVSGNITGGNISTTGNVTAGYFVGDGSQLTNLPGGTGNVTFSDQVVVGSGTNDGGGGLYLAPGPGSIANSEVQYLRVRGGDFPTHIHFDTGNNVYFDQYFGADDKFVKLEANGNIVINANDLVGNTATWTADTAGNLTLPRGGVVYETNIPDGGLNGNTIALAPSGGTNADQQLLVYPTANDGNHLHLTTGNLLNTELYVGSDDFFVKLANTGNIVVNTSGNTAAWTFGADGYLTFPRDVAGNTDPYLLIQGGPTPTIQSTDVSLAGPANLRITSNYTEFSGFTGNTVTVHADDGLISTTAEMTLVANDGAFSLTNRSNTESIYLTTDANSAIYQWEFDSTGNLNLPGNTFAVNYANGDPVSLSGTYSDANVSAYLASGVDSAGYTTVGNIQVGQTGNTQEARSYSSTANTVTLAWTGFDDQPFFTGDTILISGVVSPDPVGLNGYWAVTDASSVTVTIASTLNPGSSNFDTRPTVTSSFPAGIAVNGNISAANLTTTRVVPRIDTLASIGLVTPTAGSSDQFNVTALAVAATIGAPSGIPVDGQKLTIRIIDNGTAQALTWNAVYAPIGTTLPTTTVISKYVYVGCIYNAQSTKWDVVSVAQQA